METVGHTTFPLISQRTIHGSRWNRTRQVQGFDIYEFVQFGADPNRNLDLVNLNVVSSWTRAAHMSNRYRTSCRNTRENNGDPSVQGVPGNLSLLNPSGSCHVSGSINYECLLWWPACLFSPPRQNWSLCLKTSVSARSHVSDTLLLRSSSSPNRSRRLTNNERIGKNEEQRGEKEGERQYDCSMLNKT